MSQNSDDWITTFKALADVDMAKLDDQVTAGIHRIDSETAQNNALGSSRTMVIIATEAAKSIPLRARLVLNHLARCLVSYDLPMDRSIRDRSAKILEGYLRQQCVSLRTLVARSAPLSAMGLSTGPDTPLSEIDSNVDLEVRRIEGELNLMAANASRQRSRDSNPGTQTNVFHAPVGMVQGPGSRGVVNQQIDAGAKDALLVALDAVVSALNREGVALSFDVGEVRELADDSKTELAKPKPNAGKVRAFISEIGSAIAYAPKLEASYKTLKWAAAFVGVTLP